MRKIKTIIIHCADTPNGKHFTVENIDEWHRQRGWYRNEVDRQSFNQHLTSIGYHFVIYVDGTVESGRGADEIGSHAKGMNTGSIGICMVGKDKFTSLQWESLKKLIDFLKKQYPTITDVLGHYEVPKSGKTCPNFNVSRFIYGSRSEIDNHTLEV